MHTTSSNIKPYDYTIPNINFQIVDNLKKKEMNSGQMKKYQQVSKLYKEIVDNITTQEIGQLKLYLINLQKRIETSSSSILSQYKTVKQLLNELKQAKGKVPLHYACAKGNYDVVYHLIDIIGLDYKVKDKEGNNPYFTAIQHGHLNLVQYFVEELKCSANQSKDGEISTLHLASNHNHTDIMSYLIEKGADIEKISIYGKPINWAVGSGSSEAALLLLEKGADANGDSSGSSVAPLIIAIDASNQTIYNHLIQKGADIHTRDPSGYSVLHLAAEKGELDIVKDLVERGADIALEVEGKSPLYLAFEHNKWSVVQFLKEKEPNHKQIEAKWKQESDKIKKAKVEPNPQKAEEIKNIGNKLYADKNYEEALNEYMTALTFDQNNQIVHRNVAACCLALKQYERALAHCRQARKGGKNLKTLYREAQAYQGMGNIIDAASSMWQCCMIEPANQVFRLEFQKLVATGKKQHQEHEQAKK